MQELFPGYYRPSEENFKKLWDECIFVFDANVLLNIYRYSPKTLKNFLDILERLQDRLWLPHQAAYEYQENRLNVISAQHQPYEDISKLIDDLIIRIINAYPRHPFINIRRIKDLLNEFKTGIEIELNVSKREHRDLITNDDLRDKLDKVFNKIGTPYNSDQLKTIYSEADKRYQNEIPPGYRDNKKPESRKYGDVILWFQIKDHAKSIKKPVLLITDDRKEDWWLIHKGRTVSPRPELIQEIKNECNIEFYMYESDRFISYAQGYLKLRDDQAVDEAKEVKQYEQQSKELQRIRQAAFPKFFYHKEEDVYAIEKEIIEYIVDKPDGITIQELVDFLKKERRLVAEAVTDLNSRNILKIKTTQPDVIYQLKLE